MKQFLKQTSVAGIAILFGAAVMAKLPAMSDEAKGKAAEASAKTAWNNKMDGYQLCKSQDKVATFYKKTKQVTASACVDPGPFVYIPANSVSGIAPTTSRAPASTAAASEKR